MSYANANLAYDVKKMIFVERGTESEWRREGVEEEAVSSDSLGGSVNHIMAHTSTQPKNARVIRCLKAGTTLAGKYNQSKSKANNEEFKQRGGIMLPCRWSDKFADLILEY
jgi:hypothetical protein